MIPKNVTACLVALLVVEIDFVSYIGNPEVSMNTTMYGLTTKNFFHDRKTKICD